MFSVPNYSTTVLHFLLCVTLINGYNYGSLYLTVNALHKLEMNWNFKCNKIPDNVNLVNKTSGIVLKQIDVTDKPEGYYLTNIEYKLGILPGKWNKNDTSSPINGPQCLEFSIFSKKGDDVIEEHCLKIEPTWMEKFGDLYFFDMMLPGTHDSGTFNTSNIILKPYTETQNQNFWNQLVSGIRYFDLRIGYYKNTFFLNHDIIKCTPLVPELESIATFLKRSPREVIILDFHNFPHPKPFSEVVHHKLQTTILSSLGEYIYKTPSEINCTWPKLNYFWKINKRVIINYNDEKQLKENSWLWNGLRRYWGDKQRLKDLETYVKSITRKRFPSEMNLIMAELTLTFPYVFKHPKTNVKKLANRANPHLAKLFREENRSDNVTIVATDFYLGNDMINVAIETNRRKVNKIM